MGTVRLILALSVALIHATTAFGGINFPFVPAFIAVQSFYIISGFYMALILNEKYLEKDNSYSLFIINRFLKIYPAYWFILLITILFLLFQYLFLKNESGQAVDLPSLAMIIQYFDKMSLGTLFYLMITNIFILFQEATLFVGLDQVTGGLFYSANFRETNPEVWRFLLVPQAWSVSLEILFYIIAPFIMRRSVMIVSLMMAASFCLRVLLYKSGYNYDPWIYRFFPNELLFFLSGRLAYAIYKKIKNVSISPWIVVGILSSVILATLFFYYIPIKGRFYLYLLLIFVSVPILFHGTKKWQIDRYIGELSYPIYICHMLVLTIMVEIAVFTGKTLKLGLFVVFTLLLSYLIQKVLVAKIEILRQRRVKNALKLITNKQ